MDKDKITKHESYGAINVNRVSGQTHLFGSDALHHGFIRIEISSADMRRRFGDDRIFADRRLATVDMTFEQWAQFISSFGIGMGTPCTLRSIGSKQYAEPPEPERFSSKFQDDLKETVASAMSKLNGLTKQLDEALLPGNKPLGKKELAQAVRDIRHAAMEIEQNIPFLEDQFDEMMEKKVSGAVVEIESIVAHGLREAGMEHLRQQMPEYKLVEKQKGTALPQANPTFTLDCGCVVDENQLLSSCDDPNHQR